MESVTTVLVGGDFSVPTETPGMRLSPELQTLKKEPPPRAEASRLRSGRETKGENMQRSLGQG